MDSNDLLSYPSGGLPGPQGETSATEEVTQAALDASLTPLSLTLSDPTQSEVQQILDHVNAL